MIHDVEITILPKDLENEAFKRELVLKKVKISADRIRSIQPVRRSIDARGKFPVFKIKYEVYIDETPATFTTIRTSYQSVADKKPIHIIGAGPAGYFAALEALEHGFKPIIYERGKDVRARRRDLRAIQQFHTIDPHSNYCFGEGGAGTYSDGKLYTRSHKRGNIEKSLQILVEHGADPDILVDAHPHIGSNKLPQVVAAIRETIESMGGEIHFDSYVHDIIISNNEVKEIRVNQRTIPVDNLIVATGHSARDIYHLLDSKNVLIEFKPFALGVRIEHPQPLIDEIQYGQKARDYELPASSYQLVCQVEQRGVFSFCMCPGGLVVPAGTTPGEIVVNGMSMSKRDSPFANSGTVTAVEDADLYPFHSSGVMKGLAFQESVEKKLFEAGDGSLKAPAQRLTDFVNGNVSSNVPKSSYIPGLWSAPLHELLPDFIYIRLKEGIQQFGKKMKGYYTEEANVIGTESRTSSPVRIPRDKVTLMHPQVKGLFPCGEGAGYAGGILSAAMDGQNVAKAVVKMFS